jgi:uncharacterized integral membrane protein
MNETTASSNEKNKEQEAFVETPAVEAPQPNKTPWHTKLKRFAGFGIVLVLVIFILQNLFTIQMNFLFWKLKLLFPMTLLFFFLCGLVLGWLLKWFYQK